MSDTDWLSQDINRMRVFANVSIGGGKVKDLLLVTTSPADYMNLEFHCTLWAFDICGAAPELLFGVYLGDGADGLAKGLDCRDGVIVVGRVANSGMLISIPRAIAGWKAKPDPAKNNAGLIQTFFLIDPVDHRDGKTPLIGTTWGAALIPAMGFTDTAFRVAMGYNNYAPDPSAKNLIGLPTFIQPYAEGNYVPRNPFMGPDHGADPRAFSGRVEEGMPLK